MLLTLPNILTAQDLQHVQSLLSQVPWEDGRASAGGQARLVKNNEQLPHEHPAAQAIRALVLAGLERQPTFFSAALPLKVFTPRINRYSGQANAYGPHIDNAIRIKPDGQHVRTDVSCTVFLNDPADYEGGELCVMGPYGEQAVKLPAGHAVIYPGTSLHQVRPVTRGQRLACFFWVESMVRSDEQRQLLFDLDMALTQLRGQGESDETVRLTGVYHNLLRMWANT